MCLFHLCFDVTGPRDGILRDVETRTYFHYQNLVSHQESHLHGVYGK